MKRTILGLSGYARVGKDSIGAELGFHRTAFADRLKSDIKPIISPLRDAGLTKEQLRPIMVEYGRACRLADPDWWLKRIDIPAGGDVVICDVRYVNECQWILDWGGVVVRVWRHGYAPANAEEAKSFGEIDARFNLPVVENNSTIEEAASRVREIVMSKRDGAGKVYA